MTGRIYFRSQLSDCLRNHWDGWIEVPERDGTLAGGLQTVTRGEGVGIDHLMAMDTHAVLRAAYDHPLNSRYGANQGRAGMVRALVVSLLVGEAGCTAQLTQWWSLLMPRRRHCWLRQ